MATVGAVLGEIAAQLAGTNSPPEPPDPMVELINPPAPSQAGATVAWEGLRSFFTATAPWQHAAYQAVASGYGRI